MASIVEAEQAIIASGKPRLLLIADGWAEQAESKAAAEAVMAMSIRSVSVCEAMAALDDYAIPDIILIEVASFDDVTGVLLDRLDALAFEMRVRVIVAFPMACVDAVSARISASAVTLLCNPTRFERAAALSLASSPHYDVARETRTEREPDRLKSLADEVARIAGALSALAGDTIAPGGDTFSDGLIGYRAEPVPDGARAEVISAGDVRGIIRARRLRERFLPPDLFADPAWDMLLDLLAARIERTRVAVSSLCIAAAVPPTTALRTIRAMTERGMFVRVADGTDRRRIFIELAEATAQAMTAYVAAAKAQSSLVA